MNSKSILREIAAEEADFDSFACMAIEDASLRALVIDQMLTNPDIMVYYHCYYVIAAASELRPDLFYPHWQSFAGLLDHKNSYHRVFGLVLLATLAPSDEANLFKGVAKKYFSHINDEKLSTAQCCVRNCLKILRRYPKYRAPVLARLYNLEQHCSFSRKQIELLKWDVLAIVDALYPELEDQECARAFIRACAGSPSPKTKKKASELAHRYLG